MPSRGHSQAQEAGLTTSPLLDVLLFSRGTGRAPYPLDSTLSSGNSRASSIGGEGPPQLGALECLEGVRDGWIGCCCGLAGCRAMSLPVPVCNREGPRFGNRHSLSLDVWNPPTESSVRSHACTGIRRGSDCSYRSDVLQASRHFFEGNPLQNLKATSFKLKFLFENKSSLGADLCYRLFWRD